MTGDHRIQLIQQLERVRQEVQLIGRALALEGRPEFAEDVDEAERRLKLIQHSLEDED